MGRRSLRGHQYGLPEMPSDRAEKIHQDVQPFLPLQFSEIDVEVDGLGLIHAEDHQHAGDRPNSQLGHAAGLGSRRHASSRGELLYESDYAKLGIYAELHK
jgi:hypothetical protein